MSSSSTAAPIGREQATLARTPAGWTITSTGTLGAPLNLVNKRFELTYATDWQPIELKIDATIADPRPQGRAARDRAGDVFRARRRRSTK